MIIFETLFRSNRMKLRIGIAFLLAGCMVEQTWAQQLVTGQDTTYRVITIEAARVAGGSNGHILRAHVLPNMLPMMALTLLFTVTGSVLTEALLSFFGRTHIRMSWGTMIWFALTTFHLSRTGDQWHAALAPAVAITLFCGAFYLVGRALDEALNPRLRAR